MMCQAELHIPSLTISFCRSRSHPECLTTVLNSYPGRSAAQFRLQLSASHGSLSLKHRPLLHAAACKGSGPLELEDTESLWQAVHKAVQETDPWQQTQTEPQAPH